MDNSVQYVRRFDLLAYREFNFINTLSENPRLTKSKPYTIKALNSTKNASGKYDPDIYSIRKDIEYHFGNGFILALILCKSSISIFAKSGYLKPQFSKKIGLLNRHYLFGWGYCEKKE